MQLQAKSAAFSISASGQTITGDLPPNSNPIFFKLLWAEYSIIFLPITVDPVKLIFPILGWIAIASPAVCPYPFFLLFNKIIYILVLVLILVLKNLNYNFYVYFFEFY